MIGHRIELQLAITAMFVVKLSHICVNLSHTWRWESCQNSEHSLLSKKTCTACISRQSTKHVT